MIILEYQSQVFSLKIRYERQKQSTRVEADIGDGVVDGAVDRVVENLSENQKQIIELVGGDSYITAYEIGKSIGISLRKVQENIAKLKEMGILKRIGPAKGGHWQIIDK